MKMQSTAKLRNLRTAPRKVRLIVDLIRGKKLDEAMTQLAFSKKHSAISVKKLVDSVVANAIHNHNIEKESIVITTAFVDEGKTLYRWMPRAMGRATPIRKRTSHITIVVEGDVKDSGSDKAPTKKEEPKKKAELAEKKSKAKPKAEDKKTASAKKEVKKEEKAK